MRLKEEFSHTIEIERSRFITYLNRCFSEQEAREYIQKVKKEHPNATHHCTAFILGEHNEIARSNDDGEPSGTAGVPMLEALKKSNCHDLVAVVVRYFGGIKLGAGGLIRAYSKSISETLSKAPKLKTVQMRHYTLTTPYTYLGKLEYLLKDAQIIDKVYNESVTLDFLVETQEIEAQIQECTNGQVPVTFLEELMIEREIIND